MDIRYPANVAECFGTCYIDNRGVLRNRRTNGDYVKLPSVDFGKTKVVEAHALISFFSMKREKEKERYWK